MNPTFSPPHPHRVFLRWIQDISDERGLKDYDRSVKSKNPRWAMMASYLELCFRGATHV